MGNNALQLKTENNVLRIKGNLKIENFPWGTVDFKNAFEEKGITMYMYCLELGPAEDDIYVDWPKLLEYENTKIEVAGSVTII